MAVISAPIRNTLLALSNTSGEIAKVQQRLSTGLKVSGPTDDAKAFFQAASLKNRASDYATRKDDLGQAISTVKSASDGIASITKLVEQMKGVINSARATSDSTELSNLQTQYDSLRTQITSIATDSKYGGLNLLKASPDSLTVKFNPEGNSTLTISGINSTAAGLSLSASGTFSTAGVLDTREGEVDAALTTLRSTAATLGTNNAILVERQSFTDSQINTLQEGADKLLLADLNEESANLLALQTRLQVGTASLSLAAGAERGILGLIG